jgi:hypothetical protein
MPNTEMYLERAVREHGPYAAAVGRLAERLHGLCDGSLDGSPNLSKRIGKDLGVMIGHTNKAPVCPVCNSRLGLHETESVLLEALGRFERSGKSELIAGLEIRVCFSDGKDFEIIKDPLARYARYLRGKILRAVMSRTAQTILNHATRPFMYH